MTNMDMKKMAEVLKDLNPEGEFEATPLWGNNPRIYGNLRADELRLPTGYFWHYGYGCISNCGNTENGECENFSYVYDSTHFELKIEEEHPKKSLISSILGRN